MSRPATASQTKNPWAWTAEEKRTNFETNPIVKGTPASERSMRAKATPSRGRRVPRPFQSSMSGPTPRAATPATTRKAPPFIRTCAKICIVAPVIAGAEPIVTPISMYPAWLMEE